MRNLQQSENRETIVSKRVLAALLALTLLHAASASTIPIELHENLAPVLVVDIDGHAVRLQFDLGDRTSLVLQQSALDLIKAVPTGKSAQMQGIDGVFEVPLFKVARVKIGSAVFTDVEARLDAPRAGYQPGQIAQGYLGTGLLKSYEVVLDYPHRAFTLVARGGEPSSESCTGTVVPFSESSSKWSGEPVTEADIDLGHVILWWDTGSPATVLRKGFSQAGQHPLSGDSVATKRLVLGGTDFGPWQFQLWDMSLPGFDGFIGHDFFAEHVVCVDFPGKRLVID